MFPTHKRTHRKSLTQVCDQKCTVGFLAFLLAPRLPTCDGVDVLSDRTRVPASVQHTEEQGCTKEVAVLSVVHCFDLSIWCSGSCILQSTAPKAQYCTVLASQHCLTRFVTRFRHLPRYSILADKKQRPDKVQATLLHMM